MKIPEHLRKELESIPPGYWLIGISGGADSVFLLLAFSDMLKAGSRFEAVHVNHGIRGKEADEDEVFVRNLCETRGIPLHVYRPDLHGKTDENTARAARFDCFRNCIGKTGADGILLAHHADDRAETFLMRLLRGAGTEGLGCMPREDERNGIRILRPMLSIRRDEIRAALRAAGIAWREDSSNQNDRYLRNTVRHRLIPLMEETAPGAAGRLAEAAAIIGEDNRVLDAEAEAFLKKHSCGIHLDTGELEQAPKGLQARILRKWWQRNVPLPEEHTLSHRQTEELTTLVSSRHGTVNLPGGLTAVRGKHTIHLAGLAADREAPVPYSQHTIRIGGLALETVPGEGSPGDGKRTQEVPEGFAEGCVIRYRKPGDRIRPFGMAGSRKLQDYLTDRGIEAGWRDEIPLLCREGEVIWAAGVGAGAVPKLNGNTATVRLRWTGKMPWMKKGPKED